MDKALAALVDAICVPANARESLTFLLFFMRYIWQLKSLMKIVKMVKVMKMMRMMKMKRMKDENPVVDLHVACQHFLSRPERKSPKEKKANEAKEDTLESVLQNKE